MHAERRPYLPHFLRYPPPLVHARPSLSHDSPLSLSQLALALELPRMSTTYTYTIDDSCPQVRFASLRALFISPARPLALGADLPSARFGLEIQILWSFVLSFSVLTLFTERD